MEKYMDIIKEIAETHPHKVVLSNGKGEYKKIIFARKVLKGRNAYQLEKYTQTQVFHENIEEGRLAEHIAMHFPAEFKQMNAFSLTTDYDVKAGKKGNLAVSRRQAENKTILVGGNNRKKKYILDEGMDIPAFRELGIFTKEGKVVSSMYDKFRQINRFIEMVDDVLKTYKGDEINIIDFGCGKSYLTFAIYYYLHELKGYDIRIIGLDLKTDVIYACNQLAKKYGYRKLKFMEGNIADYTGSDEVDMVVTLHACDTATDFALAKAVGWKAKVILSVPCCQHEVNRQIANETLAPLFSYGLIKERMAALVTDAMRAEYLKREGYDTQILEFIDMEHTPKNILIRAIYTGNKGKNTEAIRTCEEMLHIDPMLGRLLDQQNEEGEKGV